MIAINNLTKKKINKAKINKIAEAFFKKYKFPADREVSLAIISDKKMKQINLSYRGQDKTTDVLTFVDLNEILTKLHSLPDI
mgnify:CR=1 FL=1